MAGKAFVRARANSTTFGKCPDKPLPAWTSRLWHWVADKLKIPIFDKDINRTNLSRSNFSNAELIGARFHCTDLRDAIFEKADAQNATFDRVDLNNANFKSAQLGNAVFKNCSIERADFTGADLRNAQGLKFDETKIGGVTLEINARDPWSTLSRTYTDQKFALYLLLTIVFVASNSASGIFSSGILFLGKSGLPLGVEVCDKLACETVNVILLVSGWHFADFWGRSFLLLASLYNMIRLVMTVRVNALSFRTAQTPAWWRWKTSAQDTRLRKFGNFCASYGPYYVIHLLVKLFGIIVLANTLLAGAHLVARTVDIPVV